MSSWISGPMRRPVQPMMQDDNRSCHLSSPRLFSVPRILKMSRASQPCMTSPGGREGGGVRVCLSLVPRPDLNIPGEIPPEIAV
jgi:hypothetical protein